MCKRKLEDQVSNFNVRERQRKERKWEEIISEIIKEDPMDLKYLSSRFKGLLRAQCSDPK